MNFNALIGSNICMSQDGKYMNLGYIYICRHNIRLYKCTLCSSTVSAYDVHNGVIRVFAY